MDTTATTAQTATIAKAGTASTGTATTEGTTTTDVPFSPIRHVDPNGPEDGDGSEDRPFSALSIVVRAADQERPVVQGLLWLSGLEHWISTDVTTFELSGGSNVVRNNAGRDSAGVLEDDINLEDGGGNIHADPVFADDGTYRPTNRELEGFGHLAPIG